MKKHILEKKGVEHFRVLPAMEKGNEEKFLLRLCSCHACWFLKYKP